MTLEAFKQTLANPTPPAIGEPLLVLWHDARGDWEAAHNIAQGIHIRDGSWLHAYLHRKEGDRWNAGYWYRQAGRPMPAGPLEQEWEALVGYFLSR